MLGRLSDRADGGFNAAMYMLACFLAASGSLILLFPAPGQRERAKERISLDESGNGGYVADGSGGSGGDEEVGEEGGGGASGATSGRGSAGEEAEWGKLPGVQAERSPSWQQRQQQRRRERGKGGLGSGGSTGELEFQPILPPRSSGPSA